MKQIPNNPALYNELIGLNNCILSREIGEYAISKKNLLNIIANAKSIKFEINVCIKMYMIHQQRRNDFHNSIRFYLIYL